MVGSTATCEAKSIYCLFTWMFRVGRHVFLIDCASIKTYLLAEKIGTNEKVTSHESHKLN
jgi:hypothetical protein